MEGETRIKCILKITFLLCPAAAAKVYSAQALVEGFIDQFVGPGDQPAQPAEESWRAVYETFNFSGTPAGALSHITA